MTKARPVTVTYTNIYCTGTIREGRLAGQPCGRLLARPRVEFWEIDMGSEALQVCHKCHTVYRLADYLQTK